MFLCDFFKFSTIFFLLIGGFVTKARDEINLQDHLQPLDVGRNPKYNKLIEDGKLCSRNCTEYPESRICYYKLVAEQYHVLGPACRNCPKNLEDCFLPQCITADGIERTVLVFNRMLPGPAFHICEGDRVIVDLDNNMPAREITIHWHGQLQRTSPWEDGVPFVTQCPITSHTAFRYDFLADTSGTHFYHSHSSLQLFDGLSGPFIVRTSREMDPVSSLYDYDLFSHTIQIRDWFHMMYDTRYPGYNMNKSFIGLQDNSYLINGRGSYAHSNTPFAEFSVKANKKYRFRIITDTSTVCSLQFAIEGHAMLLIAADGYPINPVEVRSLFLSAADIYDVVVFANQPPRPYWIRVQGYGSLCNTVVQSAILRYEESNTPTPYTQNTEKLFDAISYLPEFNNVRKSCRDNADNLCLDEVNSLQIASERLLNDPDHSFIFTAGSYEYSLKELFGNNETYRRFYLPIGGKKVNPQLGGEFEDTVNLKSNTFPPFVLLNDPRNPIINQMKCSNSCLKHCECLNLIKLGYNNVVEMVFVDTLSSPMLQLDHPFHIHGHHWRILKLGTEAELNDGPHSFNIDKSRKYPVIKDSVPIPAQGFVIIRFIADNPGFWLLHCHFTAHNDDGMQIVLQVGEPEQFLQLPENWPKCGNYLPSV